MTDLCIVPANITASVRLHTFMRMCHCPLHTVLARELVFSSCTETNTNYQIHLSLPALLFVPTEQLRDPQLCLPINLQLSSRGPAPKDPED
jgi:hypothetical protein